MENDLNLVAFDSDPLNLVIGQHYYLYLFMDIYTRKFVGAEVFALESGEDAADLLQRSVWREQCAGTNLVLHSDNGAPMKTLRYEPRWKI